MIGAGSGTFTGIVRTFCISEALKGCTICLMDINQERLDRTYDICTRYVKEINMDIKFEKTTDRIHALKGADIVINTVLATGHGRSVAGWEIADKYGFKFPGSLHIKHDESFWVNFYQFRFFEELTLDMLKYCEKAWHLMVANPVLAGTTLIQRKYPEAKVVGLCHGPDGANKMVDAMGLGREGFTFQASGPNHFIWLNKASHKTATFLKSSMR